MNPPAPFSRQRPIKFTLDIVQQPVRARMCGLGDKDRRQISPPAFLKVHAFDAETNQPINIDEVDTSTLIMVVELWSADEKTDLTLNQNIAMQSDSSPDTSLKGSPTQSRTNSSSTIEGEGKGKSPTNSSSDSDESLGDVPTRNLIGSVVTNALKLYDEQHNRGIWFVLADLSVRIEGEFKLKLKMVDLATNETLEVFSQAFKVYSAKKFPGVVDSIALGRVFASQGVKIPIRREIKEL